MSLFPADIEGLARQIIADFAADGLMVSTAESCTGGLIAGALTEISGSSAVVDRGFVTYTNEAKMDMLGVGAETLTGFGAVSRQTALQMAHGALFRSRADFAVAVTGIAGPGVDPLKSRWVSFIWPPRPVTAGACIRKCIMARSAARTSVLQRSGRRSRC